LPDGGGCQKGNRELSFIAVPYILKSTPIPKDGIGQYFPHHADAYYLVSLGVQWPHDPRYRLIDTTTSDPSGAKLFDTEEEARECLIRAGSPAHWEIKEVKGCS
jgi:hypothetical protein